MDLPDLLEKRQAAIIFDANKALGKARLRNYQKSSSEENAQRLVNLHRLVVQCVRSRNLIPIITFSQELARQRFHQGFDLAEVQIAYHVLEETVWRHVAENLTPDDYPSAFGLTSTVLGAGKDALALEYVSLASKRHLHTLDLTALFKGT